MQNSFFHNFNQIDKRGKKKSIHNVDGIIISNPNLPREILTEILQKLPVKSLIRFKCVNKSWCAFISSPEFIALHLSHVNRNHIKQYLLLLHQCFIEDVNKNMLSLHSNNESLSIITPDLELPTLSLPYIEVIEVMGPANGIVCSTDRTNIFLCNPSLRKFRRLPPCPFGLRQGFRRGLQRSAFGYDPITNDYKFIRLVIIEEEKHPHDNFIVKAEIYNISANSWREFKLELVRKILLQCSFNAVSFKGSIHWNIGDRILAFSMSTEVFGEIEYPPSVQTDWRHRENCLTVLEESLTLISGITNPFILTYPFPQEKSERYNSIEVWVMKEYGVGESWTKMFYIESPPETDSLLFFWNNDQELVVQTWEGQLISCDPCKGQEFRKYQVNGHSGGPLKVASYNESLIDPNTIVSTAPLTVVTYNESLSLIDPKYIVIMNNDD